MVGIVDYGMGNLSSVYNAVDVLAYDVEVLSDSTQVEKADHLIVPGVGAYVRAMENMRELGFVEAIRSHVEAKKPLLGICLGMQVLSSFGTEPFREQGLDLIAGEVLPLEVPAGFHTPHVGWNNIQIKYEHPIFEGVKRGVDMYFVHSYHFVTEKDQHVLCTSENGVEFTSAVYRDSVVGLQFHPEKSQDNGLKMLENFCEWDGVC